MRALSVFLGPTVPACGTTYCGPLDWQPFIDQQFVDAAAGCGQSPPAQFFLSFGSLAGILWLLRRRRRR
jgi:hypothetical protein